MEAQKSTNTDRKFDFRRRRHLRKRKVGNQKGDSGHSDSSFSLTRRASFAALCLVTVPPEKAVQSFLLTNGKFTRLDTGVVDSKERVDIVH